MPVSSIEGKSHAFELALSVGAASVLDVGPGAGTYSRLLRPAMPGSVWAALEVHLPYVAQYRLASLYDQIVVGDARDEANWSDADLIILGDVLEHVNHEDGIAMWDRARRHGKHVLLSLPIVVWAQGAVGGNTHEAHLHHWSDGQVHADLKGIQRSWVGDCIGVYLASGLAP